MRGRLGRSGGSGPLLAMVTGGAVSAFGTAMTLLAIPWFVLHATGSPAQTGVVAAAEVLALTVSSALGGPLVDRIQPRLVSIGSDLLAAIGVGVVPVLSAAGLLPLWALVLLVALIGLSRAPGDTARDALLPRLAELGGTPIERATSLLEGLWRVGRLLGAVVGGSLIALVGPAQVLSVDSASYLVSVLVMVLFVRVRLTRGEPKPWSVGGHFGELREGLRYLLSDRLLAAVVGMVLLTNGFDGAYSSVMLPTFALDVLHSSVLLGVITATSGVAMVGGMLVYGAVGHQLPRWSVYVVAFLLAGAPRLAVMALIPRPWVLLTVIAVTSFACGAINPILQSQLYRRVPEALRGRVFGVVAAGALLGVPVGTFASGFLVQYVGLTPTLLAVSALYLAVTMCPLVFPVWRRLDDDVPVTEWDESSGNHVGGAAA